AADKPADGSSSDSEEESEEEEEKEQDEAVPAPKAAADAEEAPGPKAAARAEEAPGSNPAPKAAATAKDLRAQLLGNREAAPDLRKPAEPKHPPRAKLTAARKEDRDRGRERDRDRDRKKGHKKDRDRGREKDRDRGREKDRDRGRDKDRDKDRGAKAAAAAKATGSAEGTAERRQCWVCGRWVCLNGAAWDQHQRSQYHQAARLRKAGWSSERAQTEAKNISERLWADWYAEGIPETAAEKKETPKDSKDPLAAESLTKTEKR
ncbi:nipblb, partial [Symbiodinium sp. KB8]